MPGRRRFIWLLAGRPGRADVWGRPGLVSASLSESGQIRASGEHQRAARGRARGKGRQEQPAAAFSPPKRSRSAADLMQLPKARAGSQRERERERLSLVCPSALLLVSSELAPLSRKAEEAFIFISRQAVDYLLSSFCSKAPKSASFPPASPATNTTSSSTLPGWPLGRRSGPIWPPPSWANAKFRSLCVAPARCSADQCQQNKNGLAPNSANKPANFFHKTWAQKVHRTETQLERPRDSVWEAVSRRQCLADSHFFSPNTWSVHKLISQKSEPTEIGHQPAQQCSIRINKRRSTCFFLPLKLAARACHSKMRLPGH